MISHGHFDHSASAHEFIQNSKKTSIKLVSNYEICSFMEKNQGLTEQQTEKMNKGGTIDYGHCKVHMVSADHSSSCMGHDGHM